MLETLIFIKLVSVPDITHDRDAVVNNLEKRLIHNAALFSKLKTSPKVY